ncbi:60S ribosomal protein L3, partial [Pseudoloma neurophilia]
DAVTLLEAPPMKIFGIRCYTKGINGLLLKDEILSKNLDESVKARLINKYAQKKKKNTAYVEDTVDDSTLISKIDDLEKTVPTDQTVVRVLAHTQINLLKLGCKKAHILEITVNGGSLSEKFAFLKEIFGKTVSVSDVFSEQELMTISGVTKGKGFTGVIKRFGVGIQPRKSNKGIRKVACIGAWHPAGVLRTVARAGQMGCFARTMTNKKIVK